MHPKMGAIAIARIKMPIVSKTCYLLCFNRILMVPRAFKICFCSLPIPAPVALATFWPPGGPQEASEVPSCSPFVDFWVPPGCPRAPQESPKSDQKSPKVSSAAWVLPWGAPGMPNCFPRPFIRGHLGSFFASFHRFWKNLG